MLDLILQDGDKAIFLPSFPPAVVVVKPGTIKGSGPTKLNGKKICVKGDEDSVEVKGCAYISGPHVVPGNGTLKIKKLLPNQISTNTKSKAKKVLLKGMKYIAEFKVQKPAQIPPPAGTPDPVPMYIGQGQFITKNRKVKST
ncbi:MAG: hypothetical protein DHS20C18_34890 [Saprospiraceae bacterium]|nr:MAG: hypothetical protein DHS20C18_34890 [Saprospiraceae bacterium]